ncbi:hypothetical protein ACFQPA_18420 [Halomarina halobia]|uniref:Uncharacterized protein n=1 Tax=Halomarina halobia TaxID=3033386 RepID=A0ABD6ADQ8_9EURY|nr:hypothetical protein [Halomarina sp. PSR21]
MSLDLDSRGSETEPTAPLVPHPRRDVGRAPRTSLDRSRFEAFRRTLRRVTERAFAEGRIVGTDTGIMFVNVDSSADTVPVDR